MNAEVVEVLFAAARACARNADVVVTPAQLRYGGGLFVVASRLIHTNLRRLVLIGGDSLRGSHKTLAARRDSNLRRLPGVRRRARDAGSPLPKS
jgi:hypothetical protein